MHRSPSKRSHAHLKQLVEQVVAEAFDLRARGLLFLVDEIEVSGSPPDRLRVWATLHFLSLGSPFCCCEPSCHIPLYDGFHDRLNDALRHRMGLRQPVELEFAHVAQTAHDGVEFDPPFPTYDANKLMPPIDHRDALGRTALMRAAVRGHDTLVEELLAAGADPTVTDHRGRGILEQLRHANEWIRTLIETALR